MMKRTGRLLHGHDSIRARQSLKIAGAVVVAVLCVEWIAATPVLIGSSAQPVQLMVIDTPRPRTRQVVQTPVKAQPKIVVAPAVAPTFAGRPLRRVRTIRMMVTAYSPDERSCGKFADGITASGYSVWTNGMKLVAADTRILPFKSIVTIKGYNEDNPVPVLDRGGKIKGNRLDVLYPTHAIARKWGRQWIDVDVWDYAD